MEIPLHKKQPKVTYLWPLPLYYKYFCVTFTHFLLIQIFDNLDTCKLVAVSVFQDLAPWFCQSHLLDFLWVEITESPVIWWVPLTTSKYVAFTETVSHFSSGFSEQLTQKKSVRFQHVLFCDALIFKKGAKIKWNWSALISAFSKQDQYLHFRKWKLCFFLFSTANKRRLSEFDLIQHGEYFRVMRPLFKHS